MPGFYIAPDGIDEIIKDPSDVLPYELGWYEWLRGADKYWKQRLLVHPGETFTPRAEALNGHRYRCTVGGRTGATPPTWPTSGTANISDSGVTWVRIGAEDTVTGVTVTAETGLTSASASVDATGTVTTFNLTGGVAGRAYIVNVEVTTSQSRTKQRRFRVQMRES